MLHRIKGPGVEAIRERIVHEPVGGDGKLPIVAIFESQARKSSEIVGIAHSAPLLLKYLPISRAGAVAMGGFKTFAEVRLDPVVVEQRIVDVEQKDGVDRMRSSRCLPLANASWFAEPPSRLEQSARARRVSRAGSISSEAARSAEQWEALHAIDPGGETRPDDIVLDEIRPAAGDPQEERQERIDREVDRREFASQIRRRSRRPPIGRAPCRTSFSASFEPSPDAKRWPRSAR